MARRKETTPEGATVPEVQEERDPLREGAIKDDADFIVLREVSDPEGFSDEGGS